MKAKKAGWKRLLALALAGALVCSNFSSLSAYASEGEGVTQDESSSADSSVNPEAGDSAETVQDDANQASDTDANQDSQSPETGSQVAPVESSEGEGQGEAPESGAAPADGTGAQNVRIIYVASEGGTVTLSFEDVTAGMTPQGSEAVAGEGYTFYGWTLDQEGVQGIVSTEPKYVPAVPESDITFKAEFTVVPTQSTNPTEGQTTSDEPLTNPPSEDPSSEDVAKESELGGNNDADLDDEDDLEGLNPEDLEATLSETGLLSLAPVEGGVFTYIFKNGDEVVDTQSVKNNEILFEPAVPEQDGAFLGWYNGDVQFTKFGKQTIASATNQEITLTAKFASLYHVYFMDGTGDDARVLVTKEGKEGDAIAADVKYAEGNTSVVAWHTSKELNNAVTSVELENSDITLYPELKGGNWITFDSQGGSYVEPMFVAHGASTVKPADPTKPGYKFGGWLVTGTENAFTFGSKITADVSLEAKWNAGKANYTVIHWQQNANDDKYSFKESETKNDTAGQKTAAGTKKYDGFTAQTVTQETINGDGSTIVNVYYNRNVYSVKFYEYQKVGGNWLTGYKYSWVEIADKRITAKYGAEIGDKWPTDKVLWAVEKDGHVYQAGIKTMPLGGDEFYKKATSGSYIIRSYYYTESLDGKYVLHHSDEHQSNDTDWSTTKEDHYPITGFTYTNNVMDGSKFYREKKTNVYSVTFKYSRNSYKVVFMNSGTKEKEVTLKYEAAIGASVTDYKPIKAPAGKEGYQFVGWYDNEECYGNPISWPAKMAAGNITVYAKWEAPTVKVTAYNSLKNTATAKDIPTAYAGTVDTTKLPTVDLPAGANLLGWSTSKTEFVQFNFETKIYKDTVIYPYYISKDALKVTYDINGGTGTAPVDSKSYALNSYAVVLPGTGLTKEGKVFLGWSKNQIANKASYLPGSSIQVIESIKLYAIYGDKAPTVTLTYEPNYPTEVKPAPTAKTETNIPNNSVVTLKNAADLGFAPENYEFTGWNTQADGNGKKYVAGTDIRVDAGDGNVLYAQWKKTTIVDPITVTITGRTVTEDYDGTPKTAQGYGVVISDPRYTTADFEFIGTTDSITKTDAGKYELSYEATDFRNKNTLFTNVTFVIAAPTTLIINKISVTVTAKDATKPYDGTPLTKDEIEPVSGLAAGHTLTATVTGSQTEVGSSDNVPSAAEIKDSDGNTVTGNYEVTYVNGTLTVTKDEANVITVTADSDSKEYDGTALTKNSYTYEGTLAAGDELKVTIEGEQTEVGSSTNEVTEVKVMRGTQDVTENYAFGRHQNGTLEVTKKAITVTAESASKKYDGTPLTRDEIEAVSGLAAGHTLTATVTGSQTEVGSSDNVPSKAVIKDAADNDVSSNYDVTYVNGTLTVTKDEANVITVTADSDRKEYDGTALTKNSYTYEGTLAAGDELKVTIEGEQTKVGSSANEVTEVKVMRGTQDVTENYAFGRHQNGTLEVTPKAITVTAESDEKVYDGTPLTRDEIKAVTGLVAGHTLTATVTGSQTEVGSSDNVPSAAEIKDAADNDVSSNYKVTYVNGTLTVTKDEANVITVTADSDSKEYDGTALKKNSYTYEGTLAAGDELKVTIEGEQTEVGSSTNEVTEVKVMRGTQDVTGNYAFGRHQNGTLTVKVKAITVTAESDEKPYDGTPLTRDEIKAVTGLVTGHTLTATVTGSQTEVGSSDNVPSAAVIKDAADNDVSSNYDVTYVNGKLTVTADVTNIIAVRARSDSKVYDGTPLEKDEYDTISGAVKGDDELVVEIKGSQTNVGKTENKVLSVKVMRDGTDVSSNYLFGTHVNGELEVTPRKIQLYAASYQKNYGEGDEEALRVVNPLTGSTGEEAGLDEDDNVNFKVEILGALESEKDGLKVRASRKPADEGKEDAGSLIELQPELYEDDEELFKNYEVTLKVPGYLTILKGVPGRFTLEVSPYDEVYDGELHGVTAIMIDEMNPDSDPAVTKADFKIEYSEDGINFQDEELEYKNVKFAADGITVEPHRVWVKASNKNYDDQIVESYVRITPRPITITTASASKVFDGTPLTKHDGFTVANLAEGQTVKDGDVTFTGSQTAVGSSPNTAIDARVYEDFADGTRHDVTWNYTYTFAFGTLTVTPVPVTPPPTPGPTPGGEGGGDEPTPTPTPATPPVAAAPPVDGPAVLGARRTDADSRIGGGQVLGARRGQTGEESQARNIMVMAFAAAAAAALARLGKKKKED